MNYDVIAKQTKTAIAAAGTTISLRRRTEGGFNAGEGTYTAETVSTWTAPALLKAPDKAGQYQAGTVVLQYDLMAIIAASGLPTVPKPGDLITAAGTQYTAVSVSPLFPGGTIIFYRVYLRA